MKKFIKLFVKKQKQFCILFVLSSMSFYCVQAQVIIGANRTPHPGAILELESNDNYGFLLPKVSLTSVASWGLTGSAVEGMLVFNESVTFANGLNGKGIYIWLNDAKWHLAQGVFSDMPLTLENITLSPSETIGRNKIFTAFVPAIPGALYYEWDIPTGLLGFSNTNVISLVGINAGAYTIRVKAINSQGTGTYQTKSVIITN